MKPQLTWLAAAVLAVGGLTGCGGDRDVDRDVDGDVGRFCGAFEAMIQTGEGDISLAGGLDQVKTMAESAPEEIRADAETASDGYQTITDAVEAAGLELGALDDPTALSRKDQEKLSAAAAEVDFDWAALNTAFTNIERWVEQNC